VSGDGTKECLLQWLGMHGGEGVTVTLLTDVTTGRRIAMLRGANKYTRDKLMEFVVEYGLGVDLRYRS